MDQDQQIIKDYRQAGFGHHLPFGSKPALIIIDVSRAYSDPSGPLFHSSYAELVPRIVAARKVFQTLKLPIIFTKVSYSKGMLDGGLFYKKVPSLRAFEEGSPYSDFPFELSPSKEELIVTKRYASAFFGTNLASDLHLRGIDTLVIAGVSISGCVRATTLDAMQYGFIPFVASDLVGDRDPEVIRINLFDIGQKYAEVENFDKIATLLKSQRSAG